eukprot:9496343-Pyramimonas_sp.AAC.1
MWNQAGLACKGMPQEIQSSHMERAFKLEGILHGIRAAFRDDAAAGRLAMEENDSALASTRADWELDNAAVVKNMPGTEIARRMLGKASTRTDGESM